MNKMYQAVRDFVCPFIFSAGGGANVIVGTERETVFSSSVKVGFTHTSTVKKNGWDCVDILLGEIKSIREYPIWKEDGEDRCLQVEAECCGYLETYIINSKSTIFIQMYLDTVDKDIILMALDLETLETYVVNKLV